ncbi:MAG: Uma2 family endonuclease [Anaerolineae bacterium]
MAEQIKTRMTADEFLRLPETNLPLQLLDGEVIEMPAPELLHQDCVLNTAILFRQAAQNVGGKAYVAPVDVYFDDLNILQPDVIWLAPDSASQPIGTQRLSGPPDLVAEVLSPGTAHNDRRSKFRLYEKFGVREYWLIDPRDQLVEVWQYVEGRFVLLDVYAASETFTSSLIGAVQCSAIFAS